MPELTKEEVPIYVCLIENSNKKWPSFRKAIERFNEEYEKKQEKAKKKK